MRQEKQSIHLKVCEFFFNLGFRVNYFQCPIDFFTRFLHIITCIQARILPLELDLLSGYSEFHTKCDYQV